MAMSNIGSNGRGKEFEWVKSDKADIYNFPLYKKEIEKVSSGNREINERAHGSISQDSNEGENNA
ncbi:hypothetical protein D1BOALGB6SA_528 [Olavius sp. associated proteobacterium Delta 1]|nr:hypothetical protein D1BOALGB6SA_528 [Olavius sp. associated proteobacterium Delta 1]